MEIVEVNKDVFDDVAEKPIHVFQSAVFSELNKGKCKHLHYLLFKDRKYKLGLVLGVNEKIAKSPFSAPFGGLFPITNDCKLSVLDAAIKLLVTWLKAKQYKAIEITLPPNLYHPDFISKQINCLWRLRFSITNIDLNYAFDLSRFNDLYIDNIPRNARKNLKIGLRTNLSLHKCVGEEEQKQAYQIIAQNREERGFPLRMTWEQVRETSKLINVDFFLLKEHSGNSIASAVVFYITSKIVQVVYWGDLRKYSEFKTMNVLSYRIFEYYKENGLSIIDIGPSSENSEPNHGLAEFKESIGCDVSSKYKFRFEL